MYCSFIAVVRYAGYCQIGALDLSSRTIAKTALANTPMRTNAAINANTELTTPRAKNTGVRTTTFYGILTTTDKYLSAAKKKKVFANTEAYTHHLVCNCKQQCAYSGIVECGQLLKFRMIPSSSFL